MVQKWSKLDHKLSRVDKNWSKVDQKWSREDQKWSKVNQKLQMTDKKNFYNVDRRFKVFLQGSAPLYKPLVNGKFYGDFIVKP